MTTHPDRDAAATLTKAEREAVCICAWDAVGVTPDSTHERRCTQQRDAVERILAAHSAAQPAQDDPQPDEREALAEVLAADEWPDLTWRQIVAGSTPDRFRKRADAVLAAGFTRHPDTEREAELDGPGWFWTRAEWAEWSNKLATLFTEDEAHGNPDGAQESVIFDTFAAWAEERRRHPDTGLRERVAETVRVCAINGAPTWVVDAVRDALAEPTPGVES